MITQWNNRLLHWQLAKLKVTAEIKEDLVHQFSNGREKSSKFLTREEGIALTNHLNVLLKYKAPVAEAPRQKKEDSPENRMRRKVISLCYNLHMTLPNGKIDMARVNALCVEKGPQKKPLNACTAAELPMLITVVEKIVKSYLEQYAKR